MEKVRRILITISLFAFLSSLGGCLTYNIREEIKRAEYFRQQEGNRAKGGISFSGPYCYPDRHPPVLTKIVLTSALVLFLIVAFRNPLWATPAAILSFANYPLWYLRIQRELELSELFQASGLDVYFLNASVLDFFAALFTSLLTFILLVLNVTALVLFIRRRKLP
jgi:hypothetical protein